MKICRKIETKNDSIIITFKNKIYQINKEKLLYVINLLDKVSGQPFINSDNEIVDKLTKYNLLNEDFLDNINNLW